MSDVLVSFHRADRERAGRLVAKLRESGYSVWSDDDIPEGHNRDAVVDSAFEAARCVVVVWSSVSVGPRGEAVRRAADRAAERGGAIHVVFEEVDAPGDFGDKEPVDLIRWRGGVGNASFKELLDRVDEQLQGASSTAARAGRRALSRTMLGLISSAVGVLIVFSFNVFSAQNQACAIPLGLVQPEVSDVCGALGFGQRPTKSERIAWEALPPQDCDALREHIAAYPEGAYHSVAADRLTARELIEATEWAPVVRRLPMFVGQGHPAASEPAAIADAIERARPAADQLCRQFTANTVYRLTESAPEPRGWDCVEIGGRTYCGFEGDAVCSLEERRVTVTETCRDVVPAPAPGATTDSR